MSRMNCVRQAETRIKAAVKLALTVSKARRSQYTLLGQHSPALPFVSTDEEKLPSGSVSRVKPIVYVPCRTTVVRGQHGRWVTRSCRTRLRLDRQDFRSWPTDRGYFRWTTVTMVVLRGALDAVGLGRSVNKMVARTRTSFDVHAGWLNPSATRLNL